MMVIVLLPEVDSFTQTYFKESNYNTDSLQKEIEQQSGNQRIVTLCLLAGQYRLADAEKSIPFAEEAYALSRGTDDPTIDLMATHALALAFHHTGDYPKAVRYGLDAFELAEIMHDTNAIYQVGHCVVLSYLYSNNQDLAISYTLKILDYLESWRHPAQMFEKSIRMGWIYMVSGKYSEAIPYFIETKGHAQETNLIPPQKIALNYTHLANCYLETGNNDSAWVYIKLCEDYCLENGVDYSDFALELKGKYFVRLYEFDSALTCFKEMIQQSEKKGNLLDLSINLIYEGEACRSKGIIDLAVENFLLAIETATILVDQKTYFLDKDKTVETWYTPEQIVPHYIERMGLRFLARANKNLLEISRSAGDYKNSLDYLERYNAASDKLRELDKQKDVIEINTRYVTERKEQQILLLTSENQVNSLKLKQSRYLLFAVAGFIFFAGLGGILLVRQNRMKTLQDNTILKQKLLRAQMNPHFLFNTLTSIQGYMIDNDIRKAGEFLSRFAKLIRNILDNTATEWVPVAKEVYTLENYLELQKSRYQDKFDFRIEVDHLIDQDELLIPPMLAQPVIENSIEHGFRQMERTGHLEIRLSLLQNIPITLLKLHQKGYLVSLEIVDNGIGRDKSEESRKNLWEGHSPMATSIIRERMKVLGRNLNRKLRRKIGLQITDLYDDVGQSRGTAVRIVLPAIYG